MVAVQPDKIGMLKITWRIWAIQKTAKTIKKPMRAVVSWFFPASVFLGSPPAVMMVKPAAMIMARRTRPAMMRAY